MGNGGAPKIEEHSDGAYIDSAYMVPLKLLESCKLLTERLICQYPLTSDDIAVYKKLMDYPKLPYIATGTFGLLERILEKSDLDDHVARIALERAASGEIIFKDREILEQIREAAVCLIRDKNLAYSAYARMIERKQINFPGGS